MAYISRRTKLNIFTFIIFAVIITAIVLYVVYIMPKRVTISLDYEGLENIIIEKGEVVPELPKPEKYGFNFEGWYYSLTFTEANRVKEGVDVLNGNVTIYPSFIRKNVTLYFDNNGGIGNPTPITRLYEEKFFLPTQIEAGISKQGYELYYWSLNPDGTGVRYEPGEQIQMFGEDRTMYAIWDFPYTTINYVTGKGASYMMPQKYYTGQKVPEELQKVTATKEGYVFFGWYMDEELNFRFDFNDYVLTGKSVNFYAKWNPKEFVAIFFVDGAEWKRQTIYYDGVVTKPTPPEKVGKEFLDWYVDETLLSKYNFDKIVKDNVFLYAKWGDLPPVENETPASVFKIEENADNTLTIVGIQEGSENINSLIIPRKIRYKGVDRDVVALKGLNNLEQLTMVSIPYTVKSISEDCFENCPKLAEFKLQSLSQYFKVNDGVLYSADDKILYRYPAAKAGTAYTVNPKTELIKRSAFNKLAYLTNLTVNAKTLEAYAINDNISLTSLTLGSNVETIEVNGINNCPNLTTVVSNSNNFEVENGAIYTSGKTRLIKFFNQDADVSYIAPETLVEIDDFAFANKNNLIYVELGESVVKIGNYAFTNCSHLTQIIFKAQEFTSVGNLILNSCNNLQIINLYEGTLLDLKLKDHIGISEEMLQYL